MKKVKRISIEIHEEGFEVKFINEEGNAVTVGGEMVFDDSSEEFFLSQKGEEQLLDRQKISRMMMIRYNSMRYELSAMVGIIRAQFPD